MNEKPRSAVSVAEPQFADQLDLTVEIRRIGQEALEIRYEVSNRAPEPVVLLNLVQLPVVETEQDLNRVFVEHHADGTVTISQRAWVDSPPSSIPPLHRMVLVDPAASVSGQLTLPLPLQDGNPRPATSDRRLPNAPERVQLCLGYVPASQFEAEALRAIREGTTELHPIGPALPERQNLLCSEVQHVD